MPRLLPLLALVAALILAACAAPASAPPASKPAAASAAPSPASAAAGSGASAPAASSAAAAPAASSAAPATALPARESVKYGYVAILPSAANFIAQERGYFAEQSIDVEWVQFDSGALMVQPAAAGQLDLIVGVPSPGLFNAIARDINLRIVADQSRAVTGLVVRREVSDTIRTIADLRGRRVSFNVEGSPVDYTLRLAFHRAGLGLADADVQRVVNADLGPALANGSVDAGVVPEPLPVLLESRGIGTRFPNYMEAVGGMPTSSFMAAGPSLQSRPDAVTSRWLAGYLRGVRDYLASVQDGKIADPAVLEIVSKWTNTPPEVIGQSPAHLVDRDGRVDLEDINRQQDFWVREGQIPTRADLSRAMDAKYLDAALRQLR